MSKPGARMGLRQAPFAFTEHGALMAAMVLNSPRATEVSVYVVRAFVELRDTLVAHKDLAVKLQELEQKTEALADTTRAHIVAVVVAYRVGDQLLTLPYRKITQANPIPNNDKKDMVAYHTAHKLRRCSCSRLSLENSPTIFL